MKIAICDDDVHFTGTLEEIISKESTNNGIKSDIDVFFDGSTLIQHLSCNNIYDLIFLDIEMEHINGIETARHIRIKDKGVLLIYISGYDQYLKELFEVEPFRFLSKPLDIEQLIRYYHEACIRIIKANTYFQFSFNKEIRRVNVQNIIYFESRNRIIHIFLKNGNIETFYGKLNEVEKELDESSLQFLRIHQSFLVNYIYVKRMNFFNMYLEDIKGKEICLRISEDRQKSIRLKLCKLAESAFNVK